MLRCVLLSGAIGSGKTTVGIQLADALSAQIVQVRQALVDVLGLVNPDRRTLQEKGAELDRRTRGRWLLETLTERLEVADRLVVDAVRTERQALPILNSAIAATLVYLDATWNVRRDRYETSALADPVKAAVPFEAAMRHPTEVGVVRLRLSADIVLHTDDMTPAEVVQTITEELANR